MQQQKRYKTSFLVRNMIEFVILGSPFIY